MFVASARQQRFLCPSCHRNRTLLTAESIAKTVPVPARHRQLVFTIHKRLRVFCRHDRILLGNLTRAAWQTTVEVYRKVLRRRDALPCMVASTQTFGEFINFHPSPCYLGQGCEGDLHDRPEGAINRWLMYTDRQSRHKSRQITLDTWKQRTLSGTLGA